MDSLEKELGKSVPKMSKNDFLKSLRSLFILCLGTFVWTEFSTHRSLSLYKYIAFCFIGFGIIFTQTVVSVLVTCYGVRFIEKRSLKVLEKLYLNDEKAEVYIIQEQSFCDRISSMISRRSFRAKSPSKKTIYLNYAEDLMPGEKVFVYDLGFFYLPRYVIKPSTPLRDSSASKSIILSA